MATALLVFSIFIQCLTAVSGQFNSARSLDCREGFKASGVQLIEREFKSPSLINCNLRCFKSTNCVATNFQLLTDASGGECELLLPHELEDDAVVLSKQINSVYTRIKSGIKFEVNIIKQLCFNIIRTVMLYYKISFSSVCPYRWSTCYEMVHLLLMKQIQLFIRNLIFLKWNNSFLSKSSLPIPILLNTILSIVALYYHLLPFYVHHFPLISFHYLISILSYCISFCLVSLLPFSNQFFVSYGVI